jgi:hypothetical protein
MQISVSVKILKIVLYFWCEMPLFIVSDISIHYICRCLGGIRTINPLFLRLTRWLLVPGHKKLFEILTGCNLPEYLDTGMPMNAARILNPMTDKWQKTLIFMSEITARI